MEACLFIEHSQHDPEASYTLVTRDNMQKIWDETGEHGWDAGGVAEPIEINNKKARFSKVTDLITFVRTNGIEIAHEEACWSSED
ncbi:hypothetical protein D3C71_998560 [compost metagenome]